VRIIVKNIPSRGKHVRFSRTDSWAVVAAGAAVEGDVRELEGHLHFERGTRSVISVTANGALRVCRRCDRCGTDVLLPVQASEVLRYLPEGDARFEEEHELSASDLDIGWYRDGAVEFADVVSELFALALPVRVVCDDDENCHAADDADVKPTTGHPAFAALKEIF
jgi:uncharacterized metal-binding protein YceD (DUF177 family)